MKDLMLYIVCIPLFFIGTALGNKLRKKRYIKEYPIKIYKERIINYINNCNGREFEELVALVYELMGYKVWLTKATRDGGKDVILKDDKGKIYVEVKRYSTDNKISRPLLQKLIGASVTDGVSRCIFLTTSSFTPDTEIYADNVRNIEIELVDLDKFIDMTLSVNRYEVMSYLGYDYDEVYKEII